MLRPMIRGPVAMTKSSAKNLRLLVADPDAARRRHLLAHLQGITAIEAASLSEAFDLAESQQPNAVALAVELSGDVGLSMFLRLVDALSVSFVMYGDPARDMTPMAHRKSIEFVEFRRSSDVEALLDGLLSGGAAAPPSSSATIRSVSASAPVSRDAPAALPGLILIGASTGGVSALETVLTAFPPDCPPTLVVQHIRPGFVEGMIARLDARCRPRIVAARDGLPVERGHVYIAADAERHLVLQTGPAPRCRLRDDAPRHGHRPSVDALFESATPFGTRVTAALLTGMGVDGAAGMAQIRSAGGTTVAQDEASCVVYGMPRAAVEIGAAASVLPLDRIADALLGRMSELPRTGRVEIAR
jgi:two-component system, chemotaxis family, protein-glutamate methylesterase/glutaminase